MMRHALLATTCLLLLTALPARASHDESYAYALGLDGVTHANSHVTRGPLPDIGGTTFLAQDGERTVTITITDAHLRAPVLANVRADEGYGADGHHTVDLGSACFAPDHGVPFALPAPFVLVNVELADPATSIAVCGGAPITGLVSAAFQ